MLDGFKGPLGGICPLKASFFHAFGQWSHDGAKVFDESAVEGGQPMEASNFVIEMGIA